MPLIEKCLFETVDKVALAIARLLQFEPPEGYWLAFSGGKDSACIHQLALEAGVKFTVHYNITTMDPPQLIRHMHRHYPDLVWDKPEVRYEDLLLKKGFPAMRNQRWCCEWFKESHGTGMIVTGVRRDESRWRKERRISETCFKDERRHFINPIIDWTTEDVWEFIRSRSLPYCELYDQGWKRIGCVFCPCAGRKRRRRDADRWPAMARRFIRAFERLIGARAAGQCFRKNGKAMSPLKNWKTGQEFFDWWINAPPKEVDDGQMRFFEGDDSEPKEKE